MAVRNPSGQDPAGVGPSRELSLRVSVGVLARVVFDEPRSGIRMLALERKATRLPEGDQGPVRVRAQPFGGAVRLLNAEALTACTGDWRFDSQRSRTEQDMRLFIRPGAWEALRLFCLQQFALSEGDILESNPDRELEEEFMDALGMRLPLERCSQRRLGVVEQRHPVASENVHAPGYATARIYRVDEVQITDGNLVAAMLANSARITHQDLVDMALKDARSREKGRANAVLALPLDAVRRLVRSLPEEKHYSPLALGGNILDGNVQALFEAKMVGMG